MPDKNARHNRILAFDFGTQNIGVAFGQSFTGTATALKPLKAKDGTPDWQQIASLIQKWQPDAFVVGVPINMDGSENDITQRARKFQNRLEGRFHKPGYGMDERLSSFDAESRILDNQRDSAKVSIDSLAAKLILESWFRELSGTGQNQKHD
jgi:putative Holliday junction resolvase